MHVPFNLLKGIRDAEYKRECRNEHMQGFLSIITFVSVDREVVFVVFKKTAGRQRKERKNSSQGCVFIKEKAALLLLDGSAGSLGLAGLEAVLESP